MIDTQIIEFRQIVEVRCNLRFSEWKYYAYAISRERIDDVWYNHRIYLNFSMN